MVFHLGEWQTCSFGGIVARASEAPMQLRHQRCELVVWSMRKRCHRGQFCRTWCWTKLAREGGGESQIGRAGVHDFGCIRVTKKIFFHSSSRKFSSADPNSRTLCQQCRRYFINKKEDLTCPRRCFHNDLIEQLTKWREEGDCLMVCMDANEYVYQKSLRWSLTNQESLHMK